MSIETTCQKCGEEYDMRHGSCPVCTIIRKVAYEHGAVPCPVRLWQWNGHRLMTHRPAGGWNPRGEFSVSEETTGLGIPGTFADTEAEADFKAIAVLKKKGDQMPAILAKLPVLNPQTSDRARGVGRDRAPQGSSRKPTILPPVGERSH